MNEFLEPDTTANSKNSHHAHKEPIGLISEISDDFHTGFRTSDMRQTKTHGKQCHIPTFVSFRRTTQRKRIRKWENKHFTKRHQYNAQD